LLRKSSRTRSSPNASIKCAAPVVSPANDVAAQLAASKYTLDAVATVCGSCCPPTAYGRVALIVPLPASEDQRSFMISWVRIRPSTSVAGDSSIARYAGQSFSLARRRQLCTQRSKVPRS
jgi:hypothetical protein